MKAGETESILDREMGPTLSESAENYPVVSLLGPRQSGKTTLVRQCFPEHAAALVGDALLVDELELGEVLGGWLAGRCGGGLGGGVGSRDHSKPSDRAWCDERRGDGRSRRLGDRARLLERRARLELPPIRGRVDPDDREQRRPELPRDQLSNSGSWIRRRLSRAHYGQR